MHATRPCAAPENRAEGTRSPALKLKVVSANVLMLEAGAGAASLGLARGRVALLQHDAHEMGAHIVGVQEG
eukprot:2589176-Alexandrium_andersonii.AAC.1